MHTANSVLIKAPRDRIFEVTSDLKNWTPMLPHYRSIHFHDSTDDRLKNTVTMACWRGWIPISWKSIHEIKPDDFEVHFTHLRAFTKGMVVIWRYIDTPDGVEVSITHDLNFRVRWLAPIMEPLIGKGFIEPVAQRTLATFKKILEEEASP